MSKSRTMGAGNASGSRYIALNGNNGGGGKKQGLPPSVGRKENYDRSYGNNMDVVFYMNQVGGVGKNRSMFSTNADGVHIPIKPPEPELGAESELELGAETEPKTLMDGVLLMTVGSNSAFSWNGGSRMILVQMDNTNNLPTDLVNTGYSINNINTDPTNVEKLSYTKMAGTTSPADHTYRQSYAAGSSDSLQYVKLDCSNEVTIKNTVNLSLTRPGVVTTNYLVPMNYNTSVTGTNHTSAYQGTTYQNTGPVFENIGGNFGPYRSRKGARPFGKTYKDVGMLQWPDTDQAMTFNNLADALQNSSGEVTENLIAEYGIGYNDAQGLGLGKSIEIDLFEMTPCSMATTLHGAVFNPDNSIKTTDTNGVWCNVHGANGNTDYTNGDINNTAQIPLQFPSNNTKYVTYTYSKNGDPNNVVEDTNKYGPGTAFGINTLRNIDITNVIRGYDYSGMDQILVDADIIASKADYNREDGWMQMTTTLTQGTTVITMSVLSQGFPPGSGIEDINYVTSLWMRDNNYWLDGQLPDTEDIGNGTGVVRGWVNYSPSLTPNNHYGSTVSEIDRGLIIDSSTYNQLNNVYTTTDNYSSIATDGGVLTAINPSICLFSDMSITGLNTDNFTYGVSLDVMFRALYDSTDLSVGYPARDWSGQYAISYGVHYASESSIDEFDDDNGESPSALKILVNVPSVIESTSTDVSEYYKTAMQYKPFVDDGYPYSPDPGSYLTNQSKALPDAVSGTGIFQIPSNQPVYMGFGGPESDMIVSYTDPVEDFLSSVMPADGVNYIVFK